MCEIVALYFFNSTKLFQEVFITKRECARCFASRDTSLVTSKTICIHKHRTRGIMYLDLEKNQFKDQFFEDTSLTENGRKVTLVLLSKNLKRTTWCWFFGIFSCHGGVGFSRFRHDGLGSSCFWFTVSYCSCRTLDFL